MKKTKFKFNKILKKMVPNFKKKLYCESKVSIISSRNTLLEIIVTPFDFNVSNALVE